MSVSIAAEISAIQRALLKGINRATPKGRLVSRLGKPAVEQLQELGLVFCQPYEGEEPAVALAYVTPKGSEVVTHWDQVS